MALMTLMTGDFDDSNESGDFDDSNESDDSDESDSSDDSYELDYISDFRVYSIVLIGRRKTWWHSNIRGHNGRHLGIIENDGGDWSVQRRFALKQLKDLGFGKKSLDSIMIQEVDEVIDSMLHLKVVEMDGTFNIAIINVLWEIVASKRFDHNASDTKQMMDLLNKQFKAGLDVLNFIFPRLPRNILPMTGKTELILQVKSMIRELIKDHLIDVQYDHPRDFIDVYLKQIHDGGASFDIEQLIVVCLDLFEAGAETTR